MRLIRTNAILLGLVAVLLFGFSARQIVPHRGNVFDLYPHWIGAQAFWAGHTPYTPEVTRLIQTGYYGQPVGLERDQHNSAYPAYNYIFLLPLILLPFPLAVALWMTVQGVAIAASALLWAHLLNCCVKPYQAAGLVVLLLVGFRYSATVFLLAQFVGTVLLGFTVGVLLLRQGRGEWAGILMACATIPPTMLAPLCLFVLVIFRQWRALFTFTLTLALLTGISVMQIGWWIPDWLDVLGRYGTYAKPMLALGILPVVLRVPVMLGLGGLLVHTVRRRPDFDDWEPVIVLGLLATLLLIPQTGIYYLLLLLPILVMTMRHAHSLGDGLLIASLFGMSWVWQVLFLREAESLLVPLHVLLVWAWVRPK